MEKSSFAFRQHQICVPDLELGIYVTLMGNLGDVIFGTLSRTPYPYNYAQVPTFRDMGMS
jgi:hypothetical protein